MCCYYAVFAPFKPSHVLSPLFTFSVEEGQPSLNCRKRSIWWHGDQMSTPLFLQPFVRPEPKLKPLRSSSTHLFFDQARKLIAHCCSKAFQRMKPLAEMLCSMQLTASCRNCWACVSLDPNISWLNVCTRTTGEWTLYFVNRVRSFSNSHFDEDDRLFFRSNRPNWTLFFCCSVRILEHAARSTWKKRGCRVQNYSEFDQWQ